MGEDKEEGGGLSDGWVRRQVRQSGQLTAGMEKRGGRGGGEDKYGREYIINTCVRGKCRDGDGGNGDLWPTKETAGGRPGQTDRRRNGVNGAHDEIYEDTKGYEVNRKAAR